MVGFTKGPWLARPNAAMDDWDIVSACKARWDIATIIYDAGFDASGNDVASPQSNANLIAAAPDMYEALMEFVRRVDAGEVYSVKTYNAFKAILAKADGETS